MNLGSSQLLSKLHRSVLTALCLSVAVLSGSDERLTEYRWELRQLLAIGQADLAKERLEELKQPEDCLRERFLVYLHLGDFTEAYHLLTDGLADDTLLWEEYCWAQISTGFRSSQLQVRLFSLLAAALSQDCRGVDLLLNALEDRNLHVKQLAVRLCALYADFPIQEALRVELLEGHQRRLRPELIRALAAHPNAENQRVLTKFLQRFDLTSTERRETAAALARQNAGVAEEDIERLITSESAGQRLLACCLVEEYGRDLGSIDLSPLVEDALPDIRLAALQAMRIQRMPIKDVAARLCHDVDPCVRASAAWTLLFEGEEEGHHCLMKALRSPDPRLSHYAGLVLAHGGQEGAEMAAELLQRVRDPLARVNLALGMIGEGVERDQAIEALVESLQSRQERWCRFQRGACLSGVSAQRLHAQELSLAQAVAEDLLTRLQVLGAVASVDPEAARAPLRQLLQGLQRQVAGQAGVQLLMEGDAQDLSLVRAMLDDPSPNVRVQAALLLAGLARDTTARVHLEAAYDQAPRETQERILESLGQLKDKASLPFLRSKVQEPFEGLRIIAASSILQVLNG